MGTSSSPITGASQPGVPLKIRLGSFNFGIGQGMLQPKPFERNAIKKSGPTSQVGSTVLLSRAWDPKNGLPSMAPSNADLLEDYVWSYDWRDHRPGRRSIGHDCQREGKHPKGNRRFDRQAASMHRGHAAYRSLQSSGVHDDMSDMHLVFKQQMT